MTRPKAQPSAGYLDDDGRRIRNDPQAEPCEIEDEKPATRANLPQAERDIVREGEVTFEAAGARRWAVATVKVGAKWLTVRLRVPLHLTDDTIGKERRETLLAQIAQRLRKKVDKAKIAFAAMERR